MRLVTVALTLIFLSSNFASATRTKQYLKQANIPTVTSHEQAKELARLKTQLENLPDLQNFSHINTTKLARKGGGKTVSTDVLGTYRLSDDAGSETLFIDIIDIENRGGLSIVEYVISTSGGVVVYQNLGLISSNIFFFNILFVNGVQYYAFALEPKRNYSGNGLTTIETYAICVDDDGDGFFETNEFYVCQFLGSEITTANASITRIR